jgi:uncharacterized protein YdeI (YjbR/CyaY-like superfamily)
MTAGQEGAHRVIRYMKSAAEFRRWLEAHHADTQEIWLGLHKKGSGLPSITYPEALDEALCFGWIDGVRKSLNETSYVQRFTPRRPRSVWSAVNLRHIQRLIEAGRMHPAGQKAYDERDPTKAGRYSFEQKESRLTPAMEKRFRKNRASWEFFQAQPPGYRKVCAWYVISAKKDETRQRRLERLITQHATGERLPILSPSAKKKGGRGRR